MHNNFRVSSSDGEIKAKELLSFIKRYHQLRKQKGYTKTRELFPSFGTMSKNLKISIPEVKERLEKLEDMGEIERRVSQYYLRGTRDIIMKNDKETPVKKETIKQQRQTKELTVLDKVKIIILKSIMLFIGLIATFMSVYYTQLWFSNMLGTVLSFLLSICMVGFSITAFESIILFKQNKQNILIVVFSILWIIVLLFSMTSTIAGQLNLELQKKIKEDQVNLTDNNNVLLYQEYVNNIRDFKIDLESVREERKYLQESLRTLNYDVTSDRKEYDDVNYRIVLKNRRIDKIKKQIKEIQNKKEDLLKKDVKISVEQNIDFFTWLEKVFKLDKNIFKFILFLFPAIFIDIIAPLSFAIVLFYQRNKS